MIAPSLKWNVFSFRPVEVENTPNYAGAGFGLGLGYSARQIFDFGAFAQYLPGKYNTNAQSDEATLIIYGGEVAFRITSSVVIGFRAGTADYNLVNGSSEDDVKGRHSGPMGGLSIGAMQVVKKRHFFQTSLEFNHAVVEKEDDSIGKRRIDAISVGVTYVYNGHKSRFVENSLFNSMMDSIF
jgi:hypothetical protein